MHKLNSTKLVFLLIITSIIASVLAIAKYQTTLAGNNSAKVAFLAINIDDSHILMTDISPENSEKQYIFSVTNKEQNKRNEVALNYIISIDSLNNLPLEFELYTYENNAKGSVNLLQQNGATTQKILGFNQDQIDTYMLVIKWDQAHKDYRYNHTIDYVQIEVNSEQSN